ncbi:hypothetical protein [Herbaspirillum lusitanum]|uniref:hypothetical protein n=1 Tax=Herbaspirillum lusitanum TaxID=213312 RepID=UPI00223815A3|nr:hypothetical protein [Herbaspirillum lusitanum]
MSSPFEQIMTWFSELPPGHKQDAAFLVGALMPGIQIDTELEAIADSFVSGVRSLNHDSFKEYGLTLALKTLIEHQLINQRRSKTAGKEIKSTLERLAKQHSSETFKTQAEQAEFRAAQWVVSCKKWDDMAAKHLAADNLVDYYMRSQLV